MLLVAGGLASSFGNPSGTGLIPTAQAVRKHGRLLQLQAQRQCFPYEVLVKHLSMTLTLLEIGSGHQSLQLPIGTHSRRHPAKEDMWNHLEALQD